MANNCIPMMPYMNCRRRRRMPRLPMAGAAARRVSKMICSF